MNRAQRRREIPKRIKNFGDNLKQFNIAQGLRLCTAVANHLSESRKEWDVSNRRFFTLWFTGYLAKELLLNGKEGGGKDLTQANFEAFSREFAVISDAAEPPEGAKGAARLRYLLHLEYERRVWLQPILYFLPRIYHTLVKPCEKGLQASQTTLEVAITKHYGMSFVEFFRVVIGIYFLFTRRGGLHRNVLIGAKDPIFKGWFTEDKIETALSHITTDVSAYRERQLTYRAPIVRNRPYEFNLLRNKPLIRLGNGEVVCPVPMLLADRLSTGVYFDIADHYKNEGLGRSSFTTAYGSLYEDYVGNLLSEVYERGDALLDAEVYVSNQLPKGRNQPSVCDWIVFEDDTVILIECKSGKLPAEIATSANTERFTEFVLKNYLHNGHTQFEFLHDHFSDLGRHVRSLIIYNDFIGIYNETDLYLANRPDVQKKLRKVCCHFVSTYELEMLLPMVKRITLNSILESYDVRDRTEDSSLGNFVRSQSSFHPDEELDIMRETYQLVLGTVPPSWKSS